MSDDWFAKLGRDDIKPMRVCNESFTLTRNADHLRSIYGDANRQEFILGGEQDLKSIRKDRHF